MCEGGRAIQASCCFAAEWPKAPDSSSGPLTMAWVGSNPTSDKQFLLAFCLYIETWTQLLCHEIRPIKHNNHTCEPEPVYQFIQYSILMNFQCTINQNKQATCTHTRKGSPHLKVKKYRNQMDDNCSHVCVSKNAWMSNITFAV